MPTWPRCGARPPGPRSDDDSVPGVQVRRGGATTEAKGRGSAASWLNLRPPEMAAWRHNPEDVRWGRADPRRPAASLVVVNAGILHCLPPRFLRASRLGPSRPRGHFVRCSNAPASRDRASHAAVPGTAATRTSGGRATRRTWSRRIARGVRAAPAAPRRRDSRTPPGR